MPERAGAGSTTWVFPLAGQSNMVSRADADGSAPWPNAVRFVTQDGQLVAPTAEIATPEGNGGPFLIAKRFASDFLAKRPDDAIVFVPGAVGGTSFWNHRWNPGDDLYDNLVALTKAVLGQHPDWKLRAMLFQGFETDAKNGMLATTFRRALDRFVSAVRADLGAPGLPIVFGELPPGLVDADPGHVAIRDEVALATTRLPFTAIVSSRSPSICDDDGLHYSTEGLLRIGDRYAAALTVAEANRLRSSGGGCGGGSRGRVPPRSRVAAAGGSWQGRAMPTAPIAPYDDSVLHQLRVLVRAVHGTPGRTRLYLLSGAILAVIGATAAMQVRLNAWNRPFYDAIERRDLNGFLHQLAVFFVIAAILLALNVAQTAVNQLIRVKLRELATQELIGNWMTRKRATRISRAGEIGVNPDQRIQADALNADRALAPISASACFSRRSCWRASSAYCGSCRKAW